ncbi:MAG: Sir2 family NAD-dependent protein deacetylase [Isosphaeraceae bacterium]
MPLTEADSAAIDRIAALIRPETRVLFVTGAGLSADSGLPTYRGVGGIYGDRPTRHGCSIEVALSGPMIRARPEITWEALRELEEAGRGARPNRGHEAIVELERHCSAAWVLTQNVDGFHKIAGSRNVIDIHGDLRHLVCSRRPLCDYAEEVTSYAHLEPVPKCPRCGGLVRPDVVLFGEMLDPGKIAKLRREQDQGFGLVFSIGTSSLFPYIVEPVLSAIDDDIPTVEINPGETELSGLVAYRIQAGAAEALGRLIERVRGGR